jgi:palmitoyltransferase ZDHHC9/14/18
MSFHNNTIIDATRGTIARFANHSCEPNCEMIKLIVHGEPRMALFAGPRRIQTGEELTYDYNLK